MGEVVDLHEVPSFMKDLAEDINKENIKQKKADEAEIIESLDDFSMFSWGYTPELKITRDGVSKKIKFKIKSVGVSAIIEEYQHKMPTAPGSLKTYKPESDVARALGQRRAVTVWEVNEADSNYQMLKREHETRASQMILLHGLAYDLKGPDGQVALRGSNLNAPSQIINAEGALESLRKMGMSSEHFGLIVKAIRELTSEEQAAEEQD